MSNESTPPSGHPDDATPAPGPAREAAAVPPPADPTAPPAPFADPPPSTGPAPFADSAATPDNGAAWAPGNAATGAPGNAAAGAPPASGVPATPGGPPPIVPPFNPWQAPGGVVPGGPFPAPYPGPIPPAGGPGMGGPGMGAPGMGAPGMGAPGMGAPGMGAPGFAPPPGAAWPQPPKQRTLTGGLIAALAVFGVVLLGCIGAAGAAVVHAGSSPTRAEPGDRPRYPLFPTDEPTVPGLDDDSSSTPQGPHASDKAIKDINDLSSMCDEQEFFPKAPKYQGKAPHPVAIMIRDRKDMDTRINETVYDPGYSSSKTRSDAWNVYFHPAKVQLTACVDLAGSGAKVKTCKFDDPKPDSLPLKVGTYQLTLFETATRKQLFSKKITGDDRTCPTVVLLGSDRTLYTGITDHTYVSALKQFVEK